MTGGSQQQSLLPTAVSPTTISTRTTSTRASFLSSFSPRSLILGRRWYLCLSCVLVVVPTTTGTGTLGGVPSAPTHSLAYSSSASSLWRRQKKEPAFVVESSRRRRFMNHHSMSVSSKRLESPSAQRNKEPIWKVLCHHVIMTPRILLRKSLSTSSSSSSSSLPPPRRSVRVLEIAAGAGVHTDYFVKQWWKTATTTMIATTEGATATAAAAAGSPWGLEWVPTDPDSDSRESIQAYIHEEELQDLGVQPPLALTLDQHGIKEPLTVMALETTTRGTGSGGGNSTPPSGWDLILCINMIHISPWTATLGLFKLASEQLDPDHGVLFCYGPYKENGTAVESNLDFDRSLKSRNPEWGVRDLETVIQTALDDYNLVLIERVEMPANNLSLLFQKKK